MNVLIQVLIPICCLLLSNTTLLADQRFDPTRPLWLRYPAISPDGASIAFTYGGQLRRVSVDGGEAVPLTNGQFYSTRPTWFPEPVPLCGGC